VLSVLSCRMRFGGPGRWGGCCAAEWSGVEKSMVEKEVAWVGLGSVFYVVFCAKGRGVMYCGDGWGSVRCDGYEPTRGGEVSMAWRGTD
jgi:hypothetical protein